MAISFEKAFGLHPAGMEVRAKRAEIIASNIANADTPGYKARDMDFQKALA
ncbi:MAG: flagellar basal body rod protein FlgB, partial [Colwellia sp.]|nr:flagellar basal body rod protein FlgB [Colwellia sp.]